MIVATAGHVDHGKTALIRQLTGVETDRLAEEQRRGLSINLGYAYLPQASGTPIGFIDVPGHSRFINNMIAGISGIDMGMLVVAADDGPMPQTHEHLDVLRLLGVESLVAVISKIDRVDAGRVIEVARELQSLLEARGWVDIPWFPVSCRDGEGITALKSHLLQRAGNTSIRQTEGYFRLSIDRAFSLKGVGLVVTGTASAGRVSVGDTLHLLPRGDKLRVRGIRVHDQQAGEAVAGQRCALNVAGPCEASDITRGDWLVEPGAGSAGARIDVRFTLLESASFTLKHLSPVKLYIGAKRTSGRLAILDRESCGNRLQPGDNCLAQLILDAEVACFHGEPFLLRDHGETSILGGGRVLDPRAPRQGKSRPARLSYLKAMECGTPAEALASLLEQGILVNLDSFRQAWNLQADRFSTGDIADARCFDAEGGQWIVSLARWGLAEKELLTCLDSWHAEHPLESGIKATLLRKKLSGICEVPLVMAVLSTSLRRGVSVLSEGLIHRADFKPAVSPLTEKYWPGVQNFLQQRGIRLPLLSEISSETGLETETVQALAGEAMRYGRLRKLSDRRYAQPAQLLELATLVNALADEGEPITAISLKSRMGTGRNLAVEVLEYFDTIRFTLRREDHRVVLDRDLPGRLFSG